MKTGDENRETRKQNKKKTVAQHSDVVLGILLNFFFFCKFAVTSCPATNRLGRFPLRKWALPVSHRRFRYLFAYFLPTSGSWFSVRVSPIGVQSTGERVAFHRDSNNSQIKKKNRNENRTNETRETKSRCLLSCHGVSPFNADQSSGEKRRWERAQSEHFIIMYNIYQNSFLYALECRCVCYHYFHFPPSFFFFNLLLLI